MQLPETLCATVRTLEAESRAAGRAAETAAGKGAQKQAESAKLYETMGWRERYLGGFLGGDRNAVHRRRELNDIAAKFNNAAAAKREEAAALDGKIVEKVHSYLQQNDSVFRALLVPRQAAGNLKDAVAEFLSVIDCALSEIDQAQSMEGMDLFSKNKGISLMSTMANSEASEAIRAVERAAPAFRQAVECYSDKIKTINLGNIRPEIDDAPDLIFDFAFDGFDFMSMLTLIALNEAENNLRVARAKVDKVGDIADRHLTRADNAVSAYIDRARSACRPS